MPDVKPISDDQELAKVLAGTDNDEAGNQPADAGVSTLPPVPVIETPDEPAVDTNEQPAADSNPAQDQPAQDQPAQEPAAPADEPTVDNPPMSTFESTQPQGDLATIKASALEELRPLVDKLNVTPQEKFDVILLLLRSTDDSSLIEQAHSAAKDIVDETSRAQALLDVIKEIDFLSKPKS